ncbi:MAG: hypothetical protein LQ348_003792 [Seirophora lacunosa]|nr:MAG: hypothetical protein LQ348_003792 [Seirophora lacunosa]
MTRSDVRSAPSAPLSIESWLSDHPVPENYELPTWPSNKKKRTKATHAVGSLKRRTLRDIQPNAIAQPLPGKDKMASTRKQSPQKNPTTPKQSRGRRGKQLESPEDHETARRSVDQLLLLTEIDSRSHVDAETEDDIVEDDTSLSSEGSSHNSSTRSSQRTLSPRKARAYMRDAEMSVNIAKIPSSIYSFPPAAQNLRKDLEALQKRKGLIHGSIRELAQEKLGNDDEDPLYKDRATSPTPEETFEHLQIWHRVFQIEGAAEDCEVEDSAEASWNAEVHCKILREALQGQWRSKNVWYRDITTAKIFDKELLPKIPGLSAKSKLVDFAIMVRPQESSVLEDAIERKCSSMPSKTINQTDASYIRNKPIAISMEVKRPAGNEDVATVELLTWVTAHYNMLKVLLYPNNALGTFELPVLPLIQVHGHVWNLWIAEYKNANNEIIVHRRISLGSTDKIVGIYQIIASVQRLAQWVAEEYQPWWIKAILGVDPETLDVRQA